MIKKIVLLTTLFAATYIGHAQRIDSVAVYILQQTSYTLQDLESCRFIAHSSYDAWNDELGYIKQTNKEEVSITFPNLFAVNAIGDKGHKELIYDGKQFTAYSYVRNQYAQLDYTGTVIQAIDTLNKNYTIEFPGADFFYPSFVSDVLNTGGSLAYLGIIEVNGQPCFHIAGKDQAGTGFQFWISNDNLFLPIRMTLVYQTDKGQPQYEVTFSNWELNPVNVSTLYQFVTPPGAQKIKMNSTNNPIK